MIIRCADPNCQRQHANDHWSKVRASAAGWFEQKDGTAWCPDHNPPWVSAWRARKVKR